MTTSVIQVVISLAGVVGLILLFAFLVKKAGAVRPPDTSPMRVIATLSTGVKEKLILVQLGHCQILFSSCGKGLEKVHVFEEPVIDPLQHSSQLIGQQLQEIFSRR